MFFSVQELRKPSVLIQFRFCRMKQEISKEWDKRRRVNEIGYIDLKNIDRIYQCYQEIKQLLIQGYEMDFPDDPLTPDMMNMWIRQNAIAFGFMNDKRTRNIWLDLRECFLLLRENGYLEEKDPADDEKG